MSLKRLIIVLTFSSFSITSVFAQSKITINLFADSTKQNPISKATVHFKTADNVAKYKIKKSSNTLIVDLKEPSLIYDIEISKKNYIGLKIKGISFETNYDYVIDVVLKKSLSGHDPENEGYSYLLSKQKIKKDSPVKQ